jgi:hypothetical protein
MAKRSYAKRSGFAITRVVRAPAPIVRVSAPRAAPKKHHRRSGKSSGGKSSLIACAAAGAVLGYLDKNSTTFPTVPVLGRAGTLAVVCHYWKGNIFGFSTAQLANGFAAIAAYEYTTKGSVSGW